jgi:hypothetical protein
METMSKSKIRTITFLPTEAVNDGIQEKLKSLGIALPCWGARTSIINQYLSDRLTEEGFIKKQKKAA